MAEQQTVFKEVFGKADVVTHDELGPYPEKVHVRALPERRYLWTTRALTIIAIISLCLNIIVGMTIFMLIPTIRVTPQLITFYRLSPKIVYLENSTKYVTALDTIMEEFVTEYVNLRQTIVGDIDVMNRRWGANSRLYWMSGQHTFSAFEQNSEDLIRRLRMEGLTREITIISSDRVDLGLWRVIFDSRDIMPEREEPLYARWRAYMRVGKKRVSYEERYKNPIQLAIISYSLSSLPHPLERDPSERPPPTDGETPPPS